VSFILSGENKLMDIMDAETGSFKGTAPQYTGGTADPTVHIVHESKVWPEVLTGLGIGIAAAALFVGGALPIRKKRRNGKIKN